MDELIGEEMVEAPKVDFYIKLNSEADLPTVFSAFYKQDYITVVDEETGESTQTPEGDSYLIMHSHDYAIDLVGTIYEPTGQLLVDSDGNEYPETAPVDGWHVNFRLLTDKYRDTIESIDVTYGVTPNSPTRIWL